MTPEMETRVPSARARTRQPEDATPSPYLSGSNRSSRPASGVKASSRVPSASTRVPSASKHSDKLVLEQITRLQEQCSLLERESKEAEATMQETIKQNRQIWMSIKQDNKQLKQQLMQRRGNTTKPTAAEDQASRAICVLEKKVHDLRRQYDKIMQDKKTAVAKLANCQDSVQELHKVVGSSVSSPDGSKSAEGATTTTTTTTNNSSNSNSNISGAHSGTASSTLPWDSKEGRAIRQLENRLTKAQLKANEAQSIRRMYEQVLDKVRQEQLGFGPYVQSLEAAVQAKDTEHSRLTQALLEKQHTKEKAKQELSTFHARMVQQRATREAVLLEQREKAGTLGAANRALLAQQFGPKEAALQQQSKQQQQVQKGRHVAASSGAGQLHLSQGEGVAGPGHEAGVDGAREGRQMGGCTSGGKHTGMQVTTGALNSIPTSHQQEEGGGGSHLQEKGVAERVTSAAEAVQQLCEAALVSDTQAMLDRMLPRQETYRGLIATYEAAQAQGAHLAREVDAAKQALLDFQQGSRSNATQAHLDAAQAELIAATRKAETAKESHAKILRAYVDVRAGLEHIAAMLVQLPLPPGQLPVPISENTLGDVLAQSHQRLTAALKFIRTLPKAGALLEKLFLDTEQADPQT